MFSLPRLSHHQNFNFISADSAYTLFKKQEVIFIDIRPYDDFLIDHIPGALSAPFLKILRQPGLFKSCRHDTTAVCYGFDRDDKNAGRAADLLRRRGLKEIAVLHDGFGEWLEKGYPVEKADPK